MEHSSARAGLLAGYLTTDELAKELGKSPRTIARWDGLRIGPPKTVIGKKIYFRREAVRQWLLTQEREQVRVA
jgi:ParB-like chromosome segregation protein Spo0J